jgi:hypothetical protein
LPTGNKGDILQAILVFAKDLKKPGMRSAEVIDHNAHTHGPNDFPADAFRSGVAIEFAAAGNGNGNVIDELMA